jgi:hypothetical protein
METQEALVVEVVLVHHLLRELAAQVILHQLLPRKEIMGALVALMLVLGLLVVVVVHQQLV